jgi:hypothetical protein
VHAAEGVEGTAEMAAMMNKGISRCTVFQSAPTHAEATIAYARFRGPRWNALAC